MARSASGDGFSVKPKNTNTLDLFDDLMATTPAPAEPKVEPKVEPKKVEKPKKEPVKKEEKKATPPPLPVVRKRSESTPKQFLEKLKAGDMVFLPQFQDKGTVVKIDRAKNKAKVKFGAVEVQVPFDTLEKP